MNCCNENDDISEKELLMQFAISIQILTTRHFVQLIV